ncbi:hypothetical protein GCM10027605_71120 [Micromonospora zhanjiangensis]
MELVTVDDVRAAAELIAGRVVRTPLLASRWSEEVLLKPENLQPVGSFKLRGATNAVGRLPAGQRDRGWSPTRPATMARRWPGPRPPPGCPARW